MALLFLTLGKPNDANKQVSKWGLSAGHSQTWTVPLLNYKKNLNIVCYQGLRKLDKVFREKI